MTNPGPTPAVKSAQTPTPKTLVPVFGRMIDPFTGIVYGVEPPAPYPAKIVEGSWVDCQMKAGKLVAGF